MRRLGLPAQAEQDEVVPREQGVDDLRHHRLVVADDAGEERLLRPQARDQVFADFVSDGSTRHAARRRRRRAMRQGS